MCHEGSDGKKIWAYMLIIIVFHLWIIFQRENVNDALVIKYVPELPDLLLCLQLEDFWVAGR